ncbi:hypothetical protein R1flu_003782 [Riccia fluitans]|uniref:Uncharacterized protein n=1 Tax=Riccia fluitans TaxID=41844 RepID=A0ABD1Y9Z4_9MARC
MIQGADSCNQDEDKYRMHWPKMMDLHHCSCGRKANITTTNGERIITAVVLSGSLFLLIYTVGRRRLEQPAPKPESARETRPMGKPTKGSEDHSKRYFSHNYEKSYPRVSSISEAVETPKSSPSNSNERTGTSNGRYGTEDVYEETSSEISDAETVNPYIFSSIDAALRYDLENKSKKLKAPLVSEAEQSFLEHLGRRSSQDIPNNDARGTSIGDLSSIEKSIKGQKQEPQKNDTAGSSTSVHDSPERVFYTSWKIYLWRVIPVAVTATFDREPHVTPSCDDCEHRILTFTNLVNWRCWGSGTNFQTAFREKTMAAVCHIQSKCKALVPLIALLLGTRFKLEGQGHRVFPTILVISVGFMLIAYKVEEVESWSFTELSLGPFVSAFRLVGTQNLLQSREIVDPWSSLRQTEFFNTPERSLLTWAHITVGALLETSVTLAELVVIYHTSANTMIVLSMMKEVTLLTVDQIRRDDYTRLNAIGSGVFSYVWLRYRKIMKRVGFQDKDQLQISERQIQKSSYLKSAKQAAELLFNLIEDLSEVEQSQLIDLYPWIECGVSISPELGTLVSQISEMLLRAQLSLEGPPQFSSKSRTKVD